MNLSHKTDADLTGIIQNCESQQNKVKWLGDEYIRLDKILRECQEELDKRLNT